LGILVREEALMPKLPFNEVWSRIIANEGRLFTMVRGGTFTYKACGNYIKRFRKGCIDVDISASAFEQAYARCPLGKVADVQDLWAPAFLYAILMDSAIKKSDW